MADQQEALERLRELYREKNEHLEKFLEPVEPYEFYREIFPEGSFERKGHFEDRKGNGIAVTVPKGEVDKATGIALQIEGDGKAKRCTITDELDELRELLIFGNGPSPKIRTGSRIMLIIAPDIIQVIDSTIRPTA